MIGVLLAAATFVGMTPAAMGISPDFWCDDFVRLAVTEAGQTIGGDGPAASMNTLVPHGPEPGAIVAVDLTALNPNVSTDPNYVSHVAVVESVNDDGSVNTIEGNGPDPNRVVRSVRQPEEVIGYGITPEADEQYQDRLCQQLQEAKPWIDWDCESY